MLRVKTNSWNGHLNYPKIQICIFHKPFHWVVFAVGSTCCRGLPKYAVMDLGSRCVAWCEFVVYEPRAVAGEGIWFNQRNAIVLLCVRTLKKMSVGFSKLQFKKSALLMFYVRVSFDIFSSSNVAYIHLEIITVTKWLFSLRELLLYTKNCTKKPMAP